MNTSTFKHGKPRNKGSARLFQNKYLELLLTKAPPLLIWGMYTPVLIWMLYHAASAHGFSAQNILFIFIISFLAWTLFEYLIHRFVFHWVSDQPRIERIAYIFHGNHHHYPRDRMRLFMPPVPSFIFAGFFFCLFYLVGREFAFVIFPGFIFGYLSYASIHYAIHAFAPPFKWLKPLWRQHHLHHYKNEQKGFGVSNLFWDKIFGTEFDLKKIEDNQEEVRKLMFKK